MRCCLWRHFRFEHTNRLKLKGKKNKYHANRNQMRAELIPDKTDFKTKVVTRNKTIYLS